jgi:hypothetical protein
MESKKLGIEIAKMEKDIQYIKKEQGEIKVYIKESHEQLDKKLDKFIDAMDDRLKDHECFANEKFKNLEKIFAPKWLEKWFWIIVSLIVTMISAILILGFSKVYGI